MTRQDRADFFAHAFFDGLTVTVMFLPSESLAVHFTEIRPFFAPSAIADSESFPAVTFPARVTFTEPKSLVYCLVAPIAISAE